MHAVDPRLGALAVALLVACGGQVERDLGVGPTEGIGGRPVVGQAGQGVADGGHLAGGAPIRADLGGTSSGGANAGLTGGANVGGGNAGGAPGSGGTAPSCPLDDTALASCQTCETTGLACSYQVREGHWNCTYQYTCRGRWSKRYTCLCDAPCPVTQPVAGTPCTPDGLKCEYATGELWGGEVFPGVFGCEGSECLDLAACIGGQWQLGSHYCLA